MEGDYWKLYSRPTSYDAALALERIGQKFLLGFYSHLCNNHERPFPLPCSPERSRVTESKTGSYAERAIASESTSAWKLPKPGDPRTQNIEIREEDTFVEGHRMHALVAGVGAPLVLIHGLLGAAACWQPTMRLLAGAARVYAVDALGIGRSERVHGIDGGLQASARRLRLWVDQHHLRSIDLVATSHGGAVAMCFAALFPQRVRSLVLHAPANPFCVQSRPQIRFAGTMLGRRLAHWLPAGPAWIHSAALLRMYGDPQRLREGSLEEYVTSLRVPGTVEYVLSVLRSWAPDMAALTPLLPRLRKLPTLMLWGAHDRAVSLASATRLRAVLRAPLEILPGVGHLPFEEAPELFADRVLHFLACSLSANAGQAGREPLRTA